MEAMTLEPCPFCGSPAEYECEVEWQHLSDRDAQSSGMGVSGGSIRHEQSTVRCTNQPNCYARMRGWSKESAFALWNRRAHIAQPAQAVDAGAHDRLRGIVAFLIGNAPLDGCWFGEKHPEGKGRFWWRTQLSEAFRALSVQKAGPVGDDKVLWGVVANAGRLSKRRQVRWAHVSDATGQGSNASAALCRRFGFDPDEEIPASPTPGKEGEG